MRTLFKFLSAAALIALSGASHPFVGEHAEADQFIHADGTVAMRMKPKQTNSRAVNKYDHLIDRSKSHPAPQTPVQILKDQLFGMSEERLALQERI